MRYLLSALAVFVVVSTAFAADMEARDVAYARCVMQSYEHGVTDKMANDIYVMACMRVAGYEPETGGLTGGSQYILVSGG
jgi:hypothetical protein